MRSCNSIIHLLAKCNSIIHLLAKSHKSHETLKYQIDVSAHREKFLQQAGLLKASHQHGELHEGGKFDELKAKILSRVKECPKLLQRQKFV